MNRAAVVFLALAILVAHTFGIHQTPDGEFAAPYEIAHVPFRLGRNLVYEGTALWNPGGQPVESYPSTAWVLVSAVAARLYVSPIVVTQALGLLSALATVVALAQFSPKRTAGLIAPVLLAASGSAAAAALSGTEMAAAMLLATTAFLAWERGWRRTLALVLSGLVLTRPEGLAIVGLLAVFELGARPRTEFARRPACWPAFFAPLVVITVTMALRRMLAGSWLSPFAAPLFVPDLQRWRLGGLFLASFATHSGFGLLVLALILSLSAGRMSAMGARALFLALLWWGLVALGGGDGQPFWIALVPVLPLFFLAVQECLREWMDWRESLARAVWPLLLVSVLAAFLTSKVPGDIGPLHLEEALTRWHTPGGDLARAYPRPTGRLGLMEEIRAVEHLRSLGIFLRDRIGADASIMTFWPGAIGYLSRKEVLDLSGRAWPLPGAERPFSWRGVSRVDVVASLSRDVEYLVPLIGTLSDTDAPADFLRNWLDRYDTIGATEERVRELLRALSGFELVSVPVPVRSQDPREPSERPFPLLQLRDRALIPVLSLDLDDRSVRVLARHAGHQQVVDLCLRATRRDGAELYLRPTGSWSGSGPLDARTSLLLFPTGPRSILLLETPVTEELRGCRLTAWLHNPGMRPDAPLAPVGEAVTTEL